VIVNPGFEGGIKIGVNKYAELRDAVATVPVPGWLSAATLAQWSVDVTDRIVGDTVLVRPDTEYGYRLDARQHYRCTGARLANRLGLGNSGAILD
jgi:hypothetical protein